MVHVPGEPADGWVMKVDHFTFGGGESNPNFDRYVLDNDVYFTIQSNPSSCAI